jgi:hypothetical protein
MQIVEHERFAVNLAVNRLGEKFAEGVDVYQGGSQRGLMRILTGARSIVVISRNVDLGECRGRQQYDD